MSTKKTKKQTKKEQQFDQAMHDIKIIGIVAGVALVVLLIIGFFLSPAKSYAAITRTSIPEEFDSAVAGATCEDGSHSIRCATVAYYDTIEIPRGFVAKYSGGEISDLFCIEHRKNMTGDIHYKKGDTVLNDYPGIVYIIDNNDFGVTAADVEGENYNQAELTEYLTQIAIWWYIDKKNGYEDGKNYLESGETSETNEYEGDVYRFYNNISAANKAVLTADKRFGPKIISLVSGAINYKADEVSPTISLPDSSSITYTANDKDIITNDISVNLGTSGINYTVKVADSNIKVLNTSGVEQTTFSKGESFRISAPISAIKDNKIAISANIEANYQVKNAYIYNPTADSTAQRTVLGVVSTEKKTKTLDLVHSIEIGKAKIRKIDPATNDNVSGATLVITDVRGNQVAKFKTTDQDYEISLPAGTYTITETEIPEGYSAEVKSREFTVTKDNTTEIIIENVKQIDVPNTKVETGLIYGIGAGIVIVGIILIVVAVKPEHGPKKRK